MSGSSSPGVSSVIKISFIEFHSNFKEMSLESLQQ